METAVLTVTDIMTAWTTLQISTEEASLHLETLQAEMLAGDEWTTQDLIALHKAQSDLDDYLETPSDYVDEDLIPMSELM